MTVSLTVHRSEWLAHVQATADAYGHGLVPVVKGNGYGFGRSTLHEVSRSAGATYVCVGTVNELHDVPPSLVPVVLTPTLAAPAGRRAILTVSNESHVASLSGWTGQVVVKLASSMRRYGADPSELTALVAAATGAGLEIAAFGLHLPLAGTDDDRVAEVEAWLPHLRPGVPVWVSHLAPPSFHGLQAAHPDVEWGIRVGTALWHGVPRGSFLRLSADVLHTRAVRSGERAGYRHTIVPFDGTLVAVGAGTASGVAALDDPDPMRRSPFHFDRQRLWLLEPPHMHTSLVLVPHEGACPKVGDEVDVQRPLTATVVDVVRWI
jgi:alanine racemase